VPYETFRRDDGSTAAAHDELAALVAAADAAERGEPTVSDTGGTVSTGVSDTGEAGGGADAAPPVPEPALVAPADLPPPAFVVESDETANLPRVPVGQLGVAAARRRSAPSLLDTVRADVAELRVEPIRLVVVAAVIAAVYFLVRAIR
jgi:hypothetical protein